jgi:non-ribosomal peptide synthase protein (TIGR01720 family)
LIQSVKEHLRGIPQRGIGYGLLRYLSEDVAERMSSLPQPQISFNYLGQMDTGAPAAGEAESSVFAPAGETRASDRSPLGERTHLIEIDGAVADGRLELTWAYSQNVHRSETIEAFATSFIEALRAIIAHCQSPDAGGYTASDVQEFGWDEGDLGDILAEIERRT